MQLNARRADADDVGTAQRRLAGNFPPVDERAVAAQMPELQLAGAHAARAVQARHPALSREDDGAALRIRLAADRETGRAYAVSQTAVDDVRRRLRALEHWSRVRGAVLAVAGLLARCLAPGHALQQLHVALACRDRGH